MVFSIHKMTIYILLNLKFRLLKYMYMFFNFLIYMWLTWWLWIHASAWTWASPVLFLAPSSFLCQSAHCTAPVEGECLPLNTNMESSIALVHEYAFILLRCVTVLGGDLLWWNNSWKSGYWPTLSSSCFFFLAQMLWAFSATFSAISSIPRVKVTLRRSTGRGV